MWNAEPAGVGRAVENETVDPSGFIEVDETSLRHKRYANVFALGDVIATTNAKTAAAVRKQAPVVAVNVLASLDGSEPVAAYDGYGGRLMPSFPQWLLKGTRPTRAAWFLKTRVMPPLYWHAMLKGREWLTTPRLIEPA